MLLQTQTKAEQAKAEAEGEASAIKVKAVAQSEANALLSKSLTPNLIKYQQMQKWDGKLPTITGGSIPMINSQNLLEKQE